MEFTEEEAPVVQGALNFAGAIGILIAYKKVPYLTLDELKELYMEHLEGPADEYERAVGGLN